uniref:Uncharacterized protein n=1 Tax=Anguilla anguilla TaxID=7936 RepID=A0A0E9SCI8_ANGAN
MTANNQNVNINPSCRFWFCLVFMSDLPTIQQDFSSFPSVWLNQVIFSAFFFRDIMHVTLQRRDSVGEQLLLNGSKH